MALAHDAGLGSLSLTSIVAGMLCAFGCFAVVAAIAGTILTAMGVDSTNDISGDWRDVGVATGITLAVVLFTSYLFGGYVAGRMARRAGAVNGLFVFILGVLVAAGIGTAVGMQTDGESVLDGLRSVGVPTSGDEWAALGTIAGAVALLSMLVGSVVGGMMGERWHGKLLTRAIDPSVGSEHIDLRDRDRDRDDTMTVDDERAETRDRTLVATGRRDQGKHFAEHDRHDHDHDGRHDGDADGWDGTNRTQRMSDTSTTLDDDLERRKH